MLDYKTNSSIGQSDKLEEIISSQDQLKMLLYKKRKQEKSFIKNPPEYFESLEKVLSTGNDEIKICELKKFYSLLPNQNLMYYPSFSASKLPELFVLLLSSDYETKQLYLPLVLKIIIKLSSVDSYCDSFSAHADMIKLLFSLLQENNKLKPEISSLSFSAFCNFSNSSKQHRDNSLQYIIPIVKYAQTKEKSQIKENIFLFIYQITFNEISIEQFYQIKNAILLLYDYIDESTSVILALILRNLSKYNDIYLMFNDKRSFPILGFLSNNLTSSNSQLVCITLQIMYKIFTNNSFNFINEIPIIGKFVESKNSNVVKYACLTLSAIAEHSPCALLENDAHIIVNRIIKALIIGIESIKKYLLKVLIGFFVAHHELIQNIYLPSVNNESMSFIFSLTAILDSEDIMLLVLTLNLINIIINEETKKENFEEKALIKYFSEEDAIEPLDKLKEHENEDVSRMACELSNNLNLQFSSF